MTMLHVNVPKDGYAAFGRQAKANRRSIASEVRALLEQAVPTTRKLKARGPRAPVRTAAEVLNPLRTERANLSLEDWTRILTVSR